MSDNELKVMEQEEKKALLLQGDDILISVIRAEERVKAFVKIKQLSLRATTCHDWVELGGRPYLQDTGTEKIAGLFSPTISTPIITRENFTDGHYMYLCDGNAYWGGKEIPVMGSRSSRDKFFVQYDYIEETGRRKRVDLSTEDLLIRIDPGDVRKSALTNYRNNAIKDVLGLEGITWEDLEAAGIKRSDVLGKVTYTPQAMGEGAKEQAGKIKAMLTEMYGQNYASQLENLTENIDKNGKKWSGVKNLEKCSEKKLPVVYGQVKAAYEAWQKQPKQTNSELLGVDSDRFKAAVSSIGTAKTADRVDELLSMTNGIFDAAAIKELTKIANDKKEALAVAA